MSFFLGFALGAVVTLYLMYRQAKKKKVNNPEGSNKKTNEGEEEL